MILRKPYAFFIKMFKPIHLVLGVLVLYLIVLENKIFSFFNTNMYSANNFVGQDLTNRLVSNGLYFIPLLLIVFCILILAVMFNKKKPVTFYLISIIAFIVVLFMNMYIIGFIKLLEETIVALKEIKLAHDLTLITIIVESVVALIMFIRGIGVNIKKFNFDSDISKIDIKESDNEEFEVDIKFNLDETKKNKNKRLRYLKYAYAEKKLLINTIIVIVLALIGLTTYLIITSGEKIYSENVYTVNSNCSFRINKSYVLNTDYDGNTITDNYLVVIDTSLKLNYKEAKVYLNDFVLNIGNRSYLTTTKYNNYIIDLGNSFSDDLTIEYSDYLIVFEIPKSSINKKMTLAYNDGNKITHVNLKPIKLDNVDRIETFNLGEELKFEELNSIQFRISEYDIKNSYVINYNYCANNNYCIQSKEYIKPTINQNYDKSVIRLNIEYSGDNKLKDFYSLLTTYGKIEYKINDVIKYQKYNIENIVSLKGSKNGIIYLGVNNEIENATEVSFVFNLRGRKYYYKVK